MDENAGRVSTLRDITAGFDSHDLDAILQHFADLIGERLSNLQSGQQTASEYLLTL